MSLIQGTSKPSTGGYEIAQSIRFNPSDTPQLRKAFASAGNRRTWTFSAWVKKCGLVSGQYRVLFSATNPSGYQEDIRFNYSPADQIRVYAHTIGGATNSDFQTNALYRDCGAWMHIVLAKDTTQSTASDRQKLYVNGVEPSLSTATYPTLNYEGVMNNNVEHKIGAIGSTSSSSAASTTDGLISEVHFIDGYQLQATDFGEFNDAGVWVPKKYTNASGYGTTGFYITGADSADFGADESGNGNHFTAVNLTSDDQVTDTPTENYATLNPLDNRATTYTSVGVSNGNLELDYKVGNAARSAFGETLGGGKWVFEATLLTAVGGSAYVGWSAAVVDLNNLGTQGPLVLYANAGDKRVSSTSGTGAPTSSAYGASYTNGDVIRVETDFTASTIEFFKNGTSQGSIDISGLNDGTRDYFPSVYGNNAKWKVNFGQQPFVGTPTTGYKALSTANLPAPTIKDGSAYFQTTLFTGTGAELEVNQSENSVFQPDFVWVKQRTKADNHILVDAVRGAPTTFYSNLTGEAVGTGGITSLDADGFTLSGDGSVWNNVNQSGITAAAWQWLGGNGTTTNTEGTIQSTTSASPTSGFSIVGYQGNGVNGATVGHSLSQRPELIIVKRRGSENWRTQDIFNTATDYMMLNSDAAATASAGQWNNTEPTASVFTLGTDTAVNASGADYIAYCWHSVDAYCKVGVYTGTGSANGPYVYCGFSVSWLMLKRIDAAGESWAIQDTARSPYNVVDGTLLANTLSAEITGNTAYYADILSNGFKIRASHAARNASSGQYLFLAFASNPFGGTGAAPATAR